MFKLSNKSYIYYIAFALITQACKNSNSYNSELQTIYRTTQEIMERKSWDSSQAMWEIKMRLALYRIGYSEKETERIIDSQALVNETYIYRLNKDSTKLKWLLNHQKSKDSLLKSGL